MERSETGKINRNAVSMRWGLQVPLRDGVHLHGTLYLPQGHVTRSPALVAMTPYVAQVLHDAGVHFAAHGYPFLAVDVRGRGNSEGEFRANGNEGKDGHDVVEWLARQPFCNGKVAMWGGSYAGYAQWNVAKELSPHLMTIAPVASPYRGVDGPMRNNIFSTYRVQWLTHLSGRTSQEKIFGDQDFWNQQFRRWFESGTAFDQLDTFVGNPLPIFQKWLAHPQRDAFWDAHNPTSADYARISLPILTMTGCYDANQLGALTHYREHLKHCSAEARARHYLVIGPWDHAGTRTPKAEFGGITLGAAALLDLQQLHVQWYAWTMQSGPKPEFLKRNVAYYVMGAEEWRYADSLEAVTARSMTLHLRSSGNPSSVFHSGLLTERQPTVSDSDHYVYDPRDVSLAEIESEVGPATLTDTRVLCASAGKHLVYHSSPFEAEVDVCGFFRLSAWLSIDQPDTDFHVAIHVVAADGSAIQLSTDCMRARYRESLREPKLIATTMPLRYEFENFTFIARRLKRGERLRLVIGPVNSIHMQKNYNSGGVVAEESMRDARMVTVRLFHDEMYPTALYVPIGRPDANGSYDD